MIISKLQTIKLPKYINSFANILKRKTDLWFILLCRFHIVSKSYCGVTRITPVVHTIRKSTLIPANTMVCHVTRTTFEQVALEIIFNGEVQHVIKTKRRKLMHKQETEQDVFFLVFTFVKIIWHKVFSNLSTMSIFYINC